MAEVPAPAEGPLVLEARGVVKRYLLGEVEVYALRGVDLSIRRSEFVVLLGASGSGKSTLLNVLGGLDVPRVALHGEHASEKVIAETLRSHPREVTILALGPLTNLSRALRRDRELAFYGAEDLTPSTFYREGDAVLARDQARAVVALVRPHITAGPA